MTLWAALASWSSKILGKPVEHAAAEKTPAPAVSHDVVEDVANEDADPAITVRRDLDAGAVARAIEVGQDLLQQHYFDADLREALADAYRADGRDVQAKRLFPVPRKPKEPRNLTMVSQDDPGLEERVVAATPADAPIPAVIRSGNARTFRLSAPENLGDLPDDIRGHPEFLSAGNEISLPASRALAFPNARYTGNGVFVTQDFEILNTNRVSHVSLAGAAFAPGLGWYVDLAEEPVELKEPVFILQRHPFLNYYHFVVEQACHLLTWKAHYKDLGLRILVRRPTYNSLVQQMLTLLDVSEDDLLLTDAAYVRGPLLVKPDAALQVDSRATFLTSGTLDYFDLASAQYGVTGANDRPKRIFISRRDSPKRGITNEAALVEALGPFGFEEVVLTGMPLTEQIALFSNAEAVIGGHGAGLTNIGYCRPGTYVMEITKRFTLDRVRIFWEIAAARGLRYNVICSDDAQQDHATPFATPIDEVVANLSERLT